MMHKTWFEHASELRRIGRLTGQRATQSRTREIDHDYEFKDRHEMLEKVFKRDVVAIAVSSSCNFCEWYLGVIDFSN